MWIADGFTPMAPGCHAGIMDDLVAAAPTASPATVATDDLLAQLRAGLPAEALITDPDITASYANDMASFCEAGSPRWSYCRAPSSRSST